MNLEKSEKLFCDNATIGVGKDSFAIGFASGTRASVYAFTPGHAKRLLQYLTHQVAEYEKVHGEIVVEPWTPDVLSPVQIAKKN